MVAGVVELVALVLEVVRGCSEGLMSWVLPAIKVKGIVVAAMSLPNISATAPAVMNRYWESTSASSLVVAVMVSPSCVFWPIFWSCMDWLRLAPMRIWW